ncbi:hypothetical protein DL98DRAFT_587389 [Cadophora sp. DSE1049]|nr:hypothetical protein DL98DRAFT_587389 [Cadophora sp. DSE1049]
MALLESLPGVEVTVCVDGEALKEYNTENDIVTNKNRVAARQKSRTITKYIEATTGKGFLVKIVVKAPYKMNCHNISFTVEVDGQYIKSHLMTKNNLAKDLNGPKKEWSCSIEGPVEKVRSRGAVKCMHFTEIHSTDEALASTVIRKQGLQTSKVGEIVIYVHRCSGLRKARGGHSQTKFHELDSAEKVHSKVLIKDAKTHSVALKYQKRARLGRSVHTTEIDGKDFPIAIYRFKYCSMKSLQDLQIVPRVEDLEPVVVDSPPQRPRNQGEQVAARAASLAGDFGDLSSAIEELIKKAMRRVADGINSPEIKSEIVLAPGVKRERPDDEADANPSKRAKCTKKRSIGRMIIDLTEEDV